MFGDILDVCGMALPNGRDANGMPTSFLVQARRGEDGRLLGHALEIERIVCEGIR